MIVAGTVDAHHHLWDPMRGSYPWMTGPLEVLSRPYGPEDLHLVIDAAGIERTVVVQARTDLAETHELLAIAAADARIAGVVGWADLTDPAIGDVLDRLRASPAGRWLVGIRHPVHDEPDAGWLLRPDVARGLAAVASRDLTFDLLVRERELPATIAVARRHDDLRFVIDHLAKPAIAAGATEPWGAYLRQFGRLDHVTAKVSGLVTEADWTTWRPSDLRPYIQYALEVFGPARLMFGSDWPVCLMASDYQGVVDAFEDAVGDLAGADLAQIRGGTATRSYGLDAPSA